MLVLFKSFSDGFWRYLSCTLALMFFTPAFSAQKMHPKANNCSPYFEYFVEYFSSVNENSDLDEVIDQLILLRQSILSQGIECPSIREMGIRLMEEMHTQRINPDNAQLLQFLQKIENREIELYSSNPSAMRHVSHKKKKQSHHRDKKEMQFNGRTIFGFVSALAGGLLSIIPGCQAAGVGIVIYGVSQMMEGTLEQAKENERHQSVDEPVLALPSRDN